MNNNTGLKVSVLMLTYNQERYINEAIRSVMLQETNFPFELVIGNDASTDCTGTICADWQKKYPEQIVLFNRKKNLGLQQNFIQTYAQCRGQYIAIYNPQIQISAESGTKRSIFRQKNKTKRSKKRLHTTLIKPEQKVNEDLCSGFILS